VRIASCRVLSSPKGALAANSALPASAKMVAYCRGPYCVLSPKAVRWLRDHGFDAVQLEDGFPEWRLAGLPVA